MNKNPSHQYIPKNSEKNILPGNREEWSCFHDDTYLTAYLSETYNNKYEKYTIVGVCDGDDLYIRKQFDGHQSPEALDLYNTICNMTIVFAQDLLNLGMDYD